MSRTPSRMLALALGTALAASSVTALTVAAAAPALADDTAASCLIVPSTAGAAQPVVGDDELGDEGSAIFGFITSIASNALADGATDGAGWLLNLMLGNNDDNQDDAQLLADQAAQQQQLNSIQASVNALANQLTNAEYAIQSQLTQTNYDLQVADENNNIANIQSSVQAVCELAADASTNNVSNPYLPDSTDIDTITNLRDYGKTYLADLSNALLGSEGADGIIAVYRQAWWANATVSASEPPSQATWTSEYLASMHALLDYYVNLSGQLFNAYAEAVHWENAAAPGVQQLAQDDPQKIAEFYAQLQLDIPAWTEVATSNLPTIPDGTAVDFRSGDGGTYDLWTTDALQFPDTNADQYCENLVALCVYNVWQAAATPSVVAATTVVPSVIPVPDFLPTNPLGLGGWRVPTATDWEGWVAPTYAAGTQNLQGLDPNDGVAAWASAENIPVLEAQSFAVPGGSISTIPPVIVDNALNGVFSFNDPSSASPTLMLPAAGGWVGYAGQLALVTSVTATAPPLPPVTPTAPGATGATGASDSTAEPAGPQAAAPARLDLGDATGATPTTVKDAGLTTQSTTGSLYSQTVFSSTSACSANAFTQPVGANAVTVIVSGGNGGAGIGDSGTNPGAAGGQVTATIPLAPGATIYAQVGGNGGDASQQPIDPSIAPYQYVPGGGGFGGGAAGGGNVIPVEGTGGGGGGFSGVAADSGCSQWLTVAGGGGGAGGLAEHNGNSGGGNGCVVSGCAGQTPTQVDGDTGAGTAGTFLSAGSAGEHDGKYASGGSNGGWGVGGTGGTGSNGSSNPFHDWGGGSGGGGGGGWGGGGGGGGSTGDYAGAGGGGGGSYLAAGIATATFTTTTAGPSVSLEPVLVSEYQITQTDGHVWVAPDALQYGQPITSQQGVAYSAQQDWSLLPATSTSFQLVAPGAGLCATSNGSTLVGDQCADPASSSSPLQTWTFEPQAGALAVVAGDGTAALGGQGSPAGITMGQWQSENWSTWDLTLSPISMWAAPGSASPLVDLDSPEPPGPGEPGTPGTGEPGSGGPGSGDGSAPGAAPTPGELAATGASVAPVGIGALIAVLALLLGGALFVRARRRRGPAR
ncbi:hypothetical protein [Herbiconiux sp. A18JL235]|uniref:Ricin B lectin domain-containing protein n=1 Tax=Herbiconiux sp. A18JL235 TaxID=3152363 RepID=A0AB39BE93_9MICO